MAKCFNCGEDIQDGAMFCMYCGTRQEESGQAKTPAMEADDAAAAQADRVAELIENAPVSGDAAAAAAEETAELIQSAAPAEEPPAEAPMTDEDRSARLREQPSLEAMAAAAAVPATEEDQAPAAPRPVYTAPKPAPNYAPPRPAQPSYSSSCAYGGEERSYTVTHGSYDPKQATAPSIPREDPEKPGSKSKWQIMSTWGTFGALVLMGIPVIGLIFMIVWACGGCRKYAKRNLARAVLLGIAFCLIISIVAGLLLRFVFPDVLVRAFEYLNPGYTIVF